MPSLSQGFVAFPQRRQGFEENLKGYSIVTSDAKPMYSNINTEHAIEVIGK